MGVTMATVTHDNKINWLEVRCGWVWSGQLLTTGFSPQLNETGRKLLFRDKKLKVW